MGRLVLSLIVGYILMSVVVVAAFSLAYFGMGADRAFQPGTYEVSGLWIVVSLVVGLVAAILGGWVCALVARDAKGPKALAVFVVVLGLLFAIPVLTASDTLPMPREGDVPNMVAMTRAKTPKWIAVLNPFIGAVGVTLGARLRQGAAAPAA